MLPSEQGKGIGKAIIQHILNAAKEQGGAILELNVNRLNPAVGFYKNLGFTVYKTENIPFHQFELNDFVMRMFL